MLAFLLTACFPSHPPVPTEVIEQAAPKLSAIGHPQATYQDVTVTTWSNGAPDKGQRYLDLKIRYLRPGRSAPNAMNVRIYQQSIEPCRISVDVLDDDGPEPLLLDNGVASTAVGSDLCDALSEQKAR